LFLCALELKARTRQRNWSTDSCYGLQNDLHV